MDGTLVFICRYLLTVTLVVANVRASCSYSDWMLSFDSTGLSKCYYTIDYITGFYRSSNVGRNSDYILRLEKAHCCDATNPWFRVTPLVVYADWWGTLDQSNRWANCPYGYFLQGLYRTGGGWGKIHNIEEGRCAKPVGHPITYGHCYDQDIRHCFDNAGTCSCVSDNYFVTGFYRGECNMLHCIEKLRCCKMTPQADTLDEVNKVKILVMEKTLKPMARLAHILGYGWCGGCRGPYIGDDFRLNGHRLESDTSGRCEGIKSHQRLNLDYSHWGFAVKDITFGPDILENLTPETVDFGTLTNNDDTPATKTVTRTEKSIRSVTHTKTSSWRAGQELGVEINYTPPPTGGVGGSVSYKFNYETSSTTMDSKNRQQWNEFSVSEQKTLEPHSAVSWRLMVFKTRTTVPYTATIIAKFSTKLEGFMRQGSGFSDPNTNYHYEYRGSSSRPTINYRFGDASTPFYTALKRQRETNSRPWLWGDLLNAHSDAQTVINQLTDENNYVFTLTGKMEDVIGKRVDFRWDSVPLTNTRVRRRSVETPGHANSTVDFKHLINVAKAISSDPPAPNPDPPPVNLSNSLDTPLRDGNSLEPQFLILGDEV